MKKIFTLMILLTTLTMGAKEITGKLTVSINGMSTSQDASVSLVQNDEGSYNFSIMNFVLNNGENGDVGVGNIILENLPGYTVSNKTTLTTSQIIHIPAGDLEDIDFWLGPMLDAYGGVPIVMVAQFDEKDINVDIDINMLETALEQMITVNFTNVEGGQGETFAPGDVNRDGAVSGADVTALYNILLN